jgi:hypothetical protein
MYNQIKQGDTVRLTDKAIRECRNLFGRQAIWQAKDRDTRYSVVNVREIDNGVNVVEVRKGSTEVEQIADCHLEVVNEHNCS